MTTAAHDRSRAVLALAARAEAADGVAPLNEDALLDLGRADEHYAMADDRLVGYAQLDRHGHGQLVVDPAERRNGHGRALAALLSPDAWWAFGDTPGARALAARLGLVPRRELLIMARDLASHPLTPREREPQRSDVALRAFRPGVDEPELLRVNAAAFAHHPEQGALDAAALAEREAEPWFDPAGLILAWRGDELLGFHWTKRHDAATGEVYVLGVDPTASGQGLGRTLLGAGLRHLADAGAERVILYVDGAEAGPVHLYESANFGVTRRDVAYARPGEDA